MRHGTGKKRRQKVVEEKEAEGRGKKHCGSECRKPEAAIQGIKKGVRIKIQPRFKIQYPMKNRGKAKYSVPDVQLSGEI